MIFDENLIKILEENGQPVAQGAETFSLAPDSVQGYFDFHEVSPEKEKQHAAEKKSLVRALSRGAGKIDRDGWAAEKERAERAWRGLIKGDLSQREAAMAALEQGPVSSLLHGLINREIPVFDVRGAVVKSPADVHALMQAVRSPFVETLKLLVMGSGGKVIGSRVVFAGALNETVAAMDDILKGFKGKVSGFAVSHNHPSGDPSPSAADRTFTRRLEEVAGLYGIPLIDHVVTNGRSYFSFVENGLMQIENRWSEYMPTRPADAEWEVIPTSERERLTDWVETTAAVKAVQTADPDHAHLIYLDTRLGVVAVERVKPGELVKQVIAGAGREGAFGVVVGYPATVNPVGTQSGPPFATAAQKSEVRKLEEAIKVLLIKLIDVAAPDWSGTMRELGMIMEDAGKYEAETFSLAVAPSQLRAKPPAGVKAVSTESLPVWVIEKHKDAVKKNALSSAAGRDEFFGKLDGALEWLMKDPAQIATPAGWVKFLRKAGVWGEVTMPPSGLLELIKDPAAYAAKLKGGYHGAKTVPGTIEAAKQGMDGVAEMRKIIGAGKAPAPWAVALHHFWGVLSRQLPPLQQEGLWLRLISHSAVLDAIQASIDGKYALTQEKWNATVQKAMVSTAGGAGKVGNQGTSNANAFQLMLERLNGRWQEVADVYATASSKEMGRRFWSLDAGALGIKNKVQRFIGLTFGIPGVIMDRWKFVEFWLPTGMEGAKTGTTQDYFSYGESTPADPVGIYGAYGVVDNGDSVFSLAIYEAFEAVIQRAIDQSPELQAVLGAHSNVGGAHWFGWNAIKNEAVGHSSLDLTKDLMKKFPDGISAKLVHGHLNESEYYTEGSETQRTIARVILRRGEIHVERRPHGQPGGGVPNGRGDTAGNGATGARKKRAAGQKVGEENYSLGIPAPENSLREFAEERGGKLLKRGVRLDRQLPRAFQQNHWCRDGLTGARFRPTVRPLPAGGSTCARAPGW